MTPEWWTDPANLADLVRWLATRDMLAKDELAGVLEILDHPARWTPEYEELRREERQAAAVANAGISDEDPEDYTPTPVDGDDP